MRRSRLLRVVRRLRHMFIMGALLLLLSMMGAILGCGDEEKDEPVLYGPPADTGDIQDDEFAVLYGPLVDAVDAEPDVKEDTPPVYYGPVDVAPDEGPDAKPDVPVVLYGPPTDMGPDVSEATVLYGPPPTDVTTEAQDDIPVVLYGPAVDVAEDHAATDSGPEFVTFYGPYPADVQQDCEPMAYYGPKPCASDEECQKDMGGPDWYCDKDAGFTDNCGNKVTWPTCEPKK